MSIFDEEKPKTPTPFWMKFGLIAFIAVAALNAVQSELGGGKGTLDDYPALRDFVDLTRWQTLIDPDYGREIEVHSITEGTGGTAACGQQAMVSARYVPTQERPALPADFLLPERPMLLTIGDGGAHPVLDRGVRGMRPGGVRQVLAGSRLIHPELAAPEGSPYAFELTLHSLTPFLGDPSLYQNRTIEAGYGTPALCADTLTIGIRFINAEGVVLRESGPHELTLGASQFGHGVDRGLLGLRPGGVRVLQLPPPYQPPRDMLPEGANPGEIAIVEVTFIAYNHPENTTEEEPYGPDRPALIVD